MPTSGYEETVQKLDGLRGELLELAKLQVGLTKPKRIRLIIIVGQNWDAEWPHSCLMSFCDYSTGLV